MKKKKVFRRVLPLLFVLCLVFSFFGGTALAAPEIPTRTEHSGVITKIEALLEDGSGPVGDVSQWQVFRLAAEFQLPDGEVSAGDTTTITLPDKLKFNQTSSFPITDSAGNVVANAVVDGSAKTLTLTYTDYPETHAGVDGSFYFYVQIDRYQVDGEEDIPLVFDVSGETVIGGSIHFIGIPEARPYLMAKSGWQDEPSDGRTLTFQIAVNTEGRAVQAVKITDQVQTPGVAIDPSTLRITRGTWADVHGDWRLQNEVNVTASCPVEWNEDFTSFTVELGDIAAEDGYVIRYKAIADYDFADGEIVRNEAVLTGTDIRPYTVHATATYYIAGGSAGGYVYSIRILKQDEDASALAGAVFDVIRVANGAKVGTITTDASGEASLSSILRDTYQLVEVEAPTGYLLLTEPVLITPEDFGSDGVAFVQIENTLERIDIPVTKVWIGPAADSVTVRLFADGVETDETTLSAETGWSALFEGLPRYDADGREIAYSVVEEEIPQYEANYTGTALEGFTITNRPTGTVNIPVTKVWIGPAADSATVQLLADGTVVREATLSAENGWADVFEGLLWYDPKDGHEIVYTLEEVPVEGYQTVVTGTAETGFTVTNTSEGQVSIPVTKIWVGAPADSVTVRLFADGVETGEMKLSAETGWAGVFEGLPRYDPEDGHEVVYTVEEDVPDGYASEVSGSPSEGFTVKNTNLSVRDITVEKRWVGTPLSDISVELRADGTVIDSARLTAESGWKYVFEGLLRFDPEDGHEIDYTVVEEQLENYVALIEGDPESGFVVTNTEIVPPGDDPPTTPPETPPTTPPETPPTDDVPPDTGDDGGLMSDLLTLAVFGSAVGMFALIRRRRREGR